MERGEIRERARKWIRERNKTVGAAQAAWLEDWLTDFAVDCLKAVEEEAWREDAT
jgi:hypothetical protein